MRTSMALIITLLLIKTSRAEEPRELQARGRLSFEEIDESSALEISRRLPGVWWTLNDSGDEARLFAVDSTGALIQPEWDKEYRGLLLPGAVNIDWEDLAQDDRGNLIIGAFGNNGNARRDLAVYLLPEPNPRAVNAARPLKRIPFAWPDQRDFPPAAANFDCEAVFFARGALHFLTKHRADRRTRLYRLDPFPFESLPPGQPWHAAFREDLVHPLTHLGTAEVGGLRPDIPGLVTAADATPDGRWVAILTYTGVFVVDNGEASAADGTGDLLAGEWRWLPIAAGQCEGIALDGESVWITNEQRDIFRVEFGDLVPFRP